ncbi:FkbM family methyltransferase [Oscillatoria sp. FACHB-1407]|uniref:FkbM family methyltransferase n=1 Tax=Oscillatoria sp. FACHB-1407 TaxID=2692847 RepID=UPI001F54C707|nr:FkbM family methyltransferase [Oscillatoria sp. FACHB-1407]
MPIFLASLKRGGYLDAIAMTLCLAGSRKLTANDDYAQKGWGVFAPNLSIYGFDVDADACDAANYGLENRYVNWRESHVPLALGKTSEDALLHVTQHPMFSSFYPPNEPYLNRFDKLDAARLDFTLDVETVTLDQFCQQEGIAPVDFLQVSVQGAELQVLEGARELLQNEVLAVQVDAQFSPLYLGQALFADVDAYLRRVGFTFFDLAATRCPRVDAPILSNMRPGQILWGDALYLRDVLQMPDRPPAPEQVFKLACIADVLELPDYASELLVYLTLNYGSDRRYNMADVMVESLAQFPHLANFGLAKVPIVAKIQEYVTRQDLLTTAATSAPVELSQTPQESFHNEHYQRHNQRRLEHLASLRLDLTGKTVLEVGAGIGDHTGFFVDRGCRIVSTEGRPENLDVLRSRYPDIMVRQLDMDAPDPTLTDMFEIVYCYGLLYHLEYPAEAIAYLSGRCSDLLLLETCVSFGDEDVTYPFQEPEDDPSQAMHGFGCRPTRLWIRNTLARHFEYVYLPITQPNHPEFLIDWATPPRPGAITRAVFIASRQPIDNPLLVTDIPARQQRH